MISNCIMEVRISLNSALSPKRVGCGFGGVTYSTFTAFGGGEKRDICISLLVGCPACEIGLIYGCVVSCLRFLCVSSVITRCVAFNALFGAGSVICALLARMWLN